VRSTRTGLALLVLYRVDNRIHAYSTRTAPFRASAEVLANYNRESPLLLMLEYLPVIAVLGYEVFRNQLSPQRGLENIAYAPKAA
jgi:hypothetical protein